MGGGGYDALITRLLLHFKCNVAISKTSWPPSNFSFLPSISNFRDNPDVTLYIHILYKHNFIYDYNSFPVIQFFPRHWAKDLYNKISVKCFVVSYICLAHFLLTTTKLVSVQKFFEMPSGLKCLRLLYLWRLCF